MGATCFERGTRKSERGTGARLLFRVPRSAFRVCWRYSHIPSFPPSRPNPDSRYPPNPDAASGFGGYRESGFGREGGKEGMWEYLQQTRNAERGTRNKRRAPVPRSDFRVPRSKQVAPIDRTYKLFIG